MRIVATMILGALILTTSTQSIAGPRAEARLAKALEGRVAGQPVDCIYLHDIQSSEIIDKTAIVYRTSGNRLYLNRPDVGRESLDSGDVMVTDTHSPQLCSIDTVKLLDQTSFFYSGFVGLGAFVPYTKPPTPR